MRILVVILSILLATTAVGCIAGQQEPTPNPQANADDRLEAAKQAERTVNATVEAVNGAEKVGHWGGVIVYHCRDDRRQ